MLSRKIIFLGSIAGLPTAGKMSFTAPIVSIKLVPTFKHRHNLSKIEKASPISGHLCIQKGKM